MKGQKGGASFEVAHASNKLVGTNVPDPNPDPLFKVMDPDPTPDPDPSIIKQ